MMLSGSGLSFLTSELGHPEPISPGGADGQ